ncbi:P-loop NTPase fold protein [Enterococcus sp. B1E4]|uniref:KAP family P-loop NTPase fold protein n=1 Tax=Enterococcus sp. B1E4 TaxID=3061044 RepID=UPI00265C5196|nr:P-loop NTPase fold protein [Enterococcus sp. B1E4]MDO0896218.1 P-loop NTPase fold protein [Enterococcus sp. B1E4]
MDRSKKLTDFKLKELEKKIAKLSDQRIQLETEIADEYERIWGTEEERDAIQEEQYEQYLRSHPIDPYEEQESDLRTAEVKLKLLDNELGALERKLFLHKNSDKINKNFLSKVEGDKLDREMSIDRLTSMIALQDNKTSLNIGIIGEWGSGKTTFLRLLNDKLSKSDEDNIILFNASQYDDQEQIWFSLLHRVSDKYLSSKLHFKKTHFILKALSMKKELHLICWPIIFILISIISLTYLFYTIATFIEDPALVGTVNSFFAAASVTIGAITGTKSYQLAENFLLYISNIMGNDNEFIRDSVKYPNYKRFLGNREKVRTDLKIYRDLMIKDTSRKLIIMVDELDRCSETTILSFFSSIEAFLNIPGIVFIFSINPEVVYPVVSRLIINKDKYGNEKHEMKKSGAEFIDKYIDLYFTLLPPNNYDDYIGELLNDIDGIESSNKKAISELVNIISLKEEVTPRQVKKILDISLIFHKDFVDFSFEEIAIIFIMQYYFPEFITLILSIDLKSHTKFSNCYESSTIKKRFNSFKTESHKDSSLDFSEFKLALKFLKESNKISFERNENKILRVLEYM